MKTLTILIILLFAVVGFGQTKIAQQCRENKGFVNNVTLFYNGDISIKPCPDNDVLVSNLNAAFKLQDIAYIPFQGSLNADVLFSNSSNDNNQNAAGLITTSNSFVGLANDLKITASGANKWHIGLLNQIRSGGDYTGNGQLLGIYNSVTNRGNLTATPYVQGIYSTVNLEGNATEAIGIDASALRGSAVTNPLFIGGRFTAANGYSNADEITGVKAIVRTVSTGAFVTNANALYGQVNFTFGHGITNANGLFIGNWINTGIVQNAVAVKIDNTTNIGVSSNFAIASDSIAPSYFTGNLSINGSGKLHITTPQTPASATDICTTGQIAWDSSFTYVCIATNTWKRSAIATW